MLNNITHLYIGFQNGPHNDTVILFSVDSGYLKFQVVYIVYVCLKKQI